MEVPSAGAQAPSLPAECDGSLSGQDVKAFLVAMNMGVQRAAWTELVHAQTRMHGAASVIHE